MLELKLYVIEGFWLKPHCDIKEKLMSGLIFVNNAKESEDLGTDFYNEKLEKVKTVPYKPVSYTHLTLPTNSLV